MTLTSLKKKKLEEYYRHTIIALDFWRKSDAEHSLADFRKSAEAFMKIMILDRFGDVDGEKIILGEIDQNLNPTQPKKRLEYQDMVSILRTLKITTLPICTRLEDVKNVTNPSAHNPNQPIDYETDVQLCKAQSYELTRYVYKKLALTVPAELEHAYRGNINGATIRSIKSSSWERLFNFIDNFSGHQKYILVSPPGFDRLSNSMTSVLTRLDWSFIIDFDSSSKDGGLNSTFIEFGTRSIIPLTIKQRGQKGQITAGKYGTTNWLYANGLKTISDTVTSSIKSWMSNRYHVFIKEALVEFFSKEPGRYAIVYLWDKIEYIEEIVRAISDIDTVPPDLVKHVFVTEQSDLKTQIESFEKYSVELAVFELSNFQFLSSLDSVLIKRKSEASGILVPARTKLDENTVIDISDIYEKLLDNNIVAVHQNIDRDNQTLISDKVPSFFQGEQITWTDLSINLEAPRNKYEELFSKLSGHLSGMKRSLRFDLYHRPGAGGTTLALRIAYDLRAQVPVILINHINKINTYNNLHLFLTSVNRPVLAVVEASNVAVNDLEDIIRQCNASRQFVCFLYVRRSVKLEKESELAIFLNDRTANETERNHFIGKINPYAKDKSALSVLSKKNASECEVIDFPFAINEKDYSTNRILLYVDEYLKKIPEEQVRFCTFVSLVYFYAQKPVSEIIFRSLFTKDLTTDLRNIKLAEQYIRKLLLQEFDLQKLEYTEYWRPRFSKFAESILSITLGDVSRSNWKDQIPIYANEFIKSFKENNPYLIDETRNILKAMFYDRNNEDLIISADNWSSSILNDRFSLLLRDVADKQKQKHILTTLVEAYPDETHFLGHLGRFIYEKAEEESEFQDSERYIRQALETTNGEEDFNLQHLGGMCFRRHIEYLYRGYDSSKPSGTSIDRLVELGEEANRYFNKSRALNAYNVHAYVAQMQTLITVIDFGKTISGKQTTNSFILDDEYRWFLEQLTTVRNLIDDAKAIIEQQGTLGETIKIQRDRSFVSSSEANYYQTLEHYKSSTDLLKRLVDTVDRNHRPAVRRIYIESLLLQKVKGVRSKISDAWRLLREDEVAVIARLINDDILQDSSNIYSLRLWFKMVRYTNFETSLDEIISRLKVWYDHSEHLAILRLESAFYIYVLHAIQAIKGDSIVQHNRDQANLYMKKCSDLSKNTKYNFEYLGVEDGIDSLVNHSSRRHIVDSDLARVKGTITKIESRQLGRITLKCGLEAIFVPYVGNFFQDKDETTEVDFQVGFRHSGLYAMDVRQIGGVGHIPSSDTRLAGNVTTKRVNLQLEEELENTGPLEELAPTEESDEKESVDKRPTLPGVKIVGKIDLPIVPSKKRHRK